MPLLIDKLVGWLDELTAPVQDQSEDLRFFRAFLAATLGHLYLVWIHPFGDGNGRTARLLECAILTRSGVVPWLSTNLLSDHYNRTRAEYYRRLNAASTNNDVLGFLRYAARGFVDQLREQITAVQGHQIRVSWINYVHERFTDQPSTDTAVRQRALLFALSPDENPIGSLRRLTPELAERYAGKENKTVIRDVNKLVELGLAEKIQPPHPAPPHRTDGSLHPRPVRRGSVMRPASPSSRATRTVHRTHPVRTCHQQSRISLGWRVLPRLTRHLRERRRTTALPTGVPQPWKRFR